MHFIVCHLFILKINTKLKNSLKSKPLCQKTLFKCLSPLKLELTRKTCISKGIYSIYSCILKTHNKTAILQYHDFVNSYKFLMWPDNK